MRKNNTKTGLVRNCSSCGEDHPIRRYELEEPEVIDGEEYPYAFICINTEEEVYVRETK